MPGAPAYYAHLDDRHRRLPIPGHFFHFTTKKNQNPSFALKSRFKLSCIGDAILRAILLLYHMRRWSERLNGALGQIFTKLADGQEKFQRKGMKEREGEIATTWPNERTS